MLEEQVSSANSSLQKTGGSEPFSESLALNETAETAATLEQKETYIKNMISINKDYYKQLSAL